MESFFKMSDEQFNEIRIAASKAGCLGETVYLTSPGEFSEPESFYRDAGMIISEATGKIDEILTALEKREIEERKQAGEGKRQEKETPQA